MREQGCWRSVNTVTHGVVLLQPARTHLLLAADLAHHVFDDIWFTAHQVGGAWNCSRANRQALLEQAARGGGDLGGLGGCPRARSPAWRAKAGLGEPTLDCGTAAREQDLVAWMRATRPFCADTGNTAAGSTPGSRRPSRMAADLGFDARASSPARPTARRSCWSTTRRRAGARCQPARQLRHPRDRSG